MPPIRSIDCTKNTLTFIDNKGQKHVFDASKIPVGKNTVTDLEDYINTQWLPPLLGGNYQMEVHIFNYNPLEITVYVADNGQKIPKDWWVDAS